MTSLVTGATGFIGRHLVARLLQDGHEVNYLGRRQDPRLDGRAAFHSWTRGETPPLDSVPRLDTAFHLAGEPISQRWTKEVKDRIYRSRVEGTRTLVSAIGRLKHKPSALVSASAVGFYGDCGDQILTEQSPPGTDFLARVCVDWEREALAAAGWGLRVVLVRIAVVLGRDGGAFPKMLTPFRLGIGGPFGSGQQWMPWIHVDDLISLLLFSALEPAVEGPVNASTPEPVTNAQFTGVLGRALHRPAILPVPRFALKLALGELGGFVLASERVIPEKAKRLNFVWKYPDIESTVRSLTAASLF